MPHPFVQLQRECSMAQLFTARVPESDSLGSHAGPALHWLYHHSEPHNGQLPHRQADSGKGPAPVKRLVPYTWKVLAEYQIYNYHDYCCRRRMKLLSNLDNAFICCHRYLAPNIPLVRSSRTKTSNLNPSPSSLIIILVHFTHPIGTDFSWRWIQYIQGSTWSNPVL